MALTFEIDTSIVMPNITVEKAYVDGVHKAYRITANAGYVMYDTTANYTELDPITMEEIPVNYYYTQWTFTVVMPTHLWQNAWVAVPRNSVDENYIFGGGNDNDHEIM